MKAATEADAGRYAKSRGQVHLGDEPALDVGDRRTAPPDRRAVSLRWLAGTVLTGVASTALMGGALYASLDRDAYFAQSPDVFAASTYVDAAAIPAGGSKSDRMSMSLPRFSSRQIMRLDTATRVGDREFIKVKPFARVNASLALERTDLTRDLKPLNPIKLFQSDDSPETAKAEAPEKVEGEVSLVLKPFDESAVAAVAAPAEAAIPEEEIAALVDEAAEKAPGETIVLTPQASVAADMFDMGFNAFSFGPREMDSFADLVISAYAENVTEIAKSEGQIRGEERTLAPDERLLLVGPNDTLHGLLEKNGSTEAEATAIIAAMHEYFAPEFLREGMRLRLNVSNGDAERTRLRPVRVSIYDNVRHRVTVVLSDTDDYVAIDDPGELSGDEIETETAARGPAGPTPTLHVSLYETALKNEVPRALIDQLVKVYSYDVDFNRRVKPGESFEVFYSLDEEDESRTGDVLYTALTIDGEARRYYRFETPDDGTVDYYDADGRSARKFLMRKPIGTGVMRSGFGMRRHPILGYSRMHTGVDYAAPRGTPIVASGNGVVDRAGWKSGYGKSVALRHANGYETTYNHMSDIARGMAPGTKVRQGQVIGYVGTTGMSTGNHLHYEVLVDGRFVNPLRISVPRGRELEDEILVAFEKERDRIDAIMNRSPAATRIAVAQ